MRAAERAYQDGVSQANRHGDRLATVRFLMMEGGCRMLMFEYRSALSAFVEARDEAVAIHDTVDVGAISGNLSSLYLQMWDLPAARQAAEVGLDTAASVPSAYYVPQLLLQAGRLDALEGSAGSARAESYYRRGIEAARTQSDRQTEARGLDLLGDEQLSHDALSDAEASFEQALRLRTALSSPELGFSYGRLGALRLAQRRLDEAGQYTELALQTVREGKLGWPTYLMLQQLGSVYLAQGATEAALADFSEAVASSAQWRLNVLPSRSSLTSANVGLEEKVFRSFIDLAADQAVRSHNADWATRAFQALEMNRAASLRESLALSEVWRTKLPPEYWEAVGQWDARQSQALRTGGHGDSSATNLLLKITEMEATAGLDFTVSRAENFRNQTSLNHFQQGLEGSELFLSFFLGRESSYLWAVSRSSLHVYRLPADREIGAHVEAFREAVLSSRSRGVEDGAVEATGRQLYQDLFGSLDATEKAKSNWLLSLEGVLFKVPYAALVEEGGGHRGYLVERHSIQTVPGALLLQRREPSPARGGLFLGVGDPIYNAADKRWASGAAAAPALEKNMPGQLARLVASSEEVRAGAASWQRDSGTATILEGFDAGRDRFLDQLSRQPRVIHLATHVLFPQSGFAEATHEQAFIAFSIPARSTSAAVMPTGTVKEGPQYLTTTRIATLHVPGALVVMTGCATGTGEVQPGAGLLGLTRAWLMAGATGVLSTAWPVEDSSGEMFSQFYKYYPERSAAEALQKSQIAMLHRAAPSEWAPYQLTGGAR